MLERTFSRSLAVFAVALVVASAVASAAPAFWSLGGELGRAAWSLLFGEGTGIVTKHGCEIDPNGKPRCIPTPKHGCEIGPDGTPRCAPAPKLGCEIDPDGKPRCTP